MSRLPGSRFAVFTAALIVLTLLALEVVARVAIAVLQPDPRFDFTPIADRERERRQKLEELLETQGRALVELDAELGWRYRADYRGRLYSSNSVGVRGRREYAPTPPPGSLRIAAFGDSFVHGNEVGDDEAWSAVLETLDPRFEVLNYGVGGYGTDQALLLYERLGADLDAQVVLLGFVEVDYARNVNRFRRFLSVSELALFKPRFVLDDSATGALTLVPNPFPSETELRGLLEAPDAIVRAAPHDWFYQPLVWRNPLYDVSGLARLVSSGISDAWRARLRPDGLYAGNRFNTSSEAYRVLLALVDRFAELAEARGQHFVLLIFPSRDSDIWGDGPPVYQPLLDDLDGRHLVLDLAGTLRADPTLAPDNLRKTSNHYGVAANAAVGRAVRDFAIDQGWITTGLSRAADAQGPGLPTPDR